MEKQYKRTLEQRQRISEGTKKAMTPEICKKVSEKTKEAMQDPQIRKKISIAVKNRPQELKDKFQKSRLGKPPWIAGKKHTEETKQIIKDKRKLQINTNKGSKWTEEQKQHLKNSKALNPMSEQQRKVVHLNFGNKYDNWKGKHFSEEHKKKISLGNIGRISGMQGKKSNKKGKTFEEMYGIEKANRLKSIWHKTIEKLILPIKDTKIEVKIQNFLKQLNIEYFTHQYMNIEHNYRCDILIPVQLGITQKTIIECDGDAYHFNPKKYKETDKIHKKGLTAKEKWELDKTRTNELVEKGFRVLRLWESEINAITLDKFKFKLEQYGQI